MYEVCVAEGPNEISDLCEEIKKRYGESKEIRHRALCALASTMRKAVEEKGLPLTPLSYFIATMSALNKIVASFSFSSDNSSPPFNIKAAISLTCFLSIVLPLIPPESNMSLRASNAIRVLDLLLNIPEVAQSQATIRVVVKSLGFLVKRCDLEDSVFKIILGFSIDKHRNELREAAQVWVEEIFRSIEDTYVINEASKLFHSMFCQSLPNANAVAWSKVEITKDSELAEKYKVMESVHILSVLKRIVLYLWDDIVSKIMWKFHLVLGPKYSLLTRPAFAVLEVILDAWRVKEIIVPDSIISVLGMYIALEENNPGDTVLAACVLMKKCINKIYADADKRNIWVINLPLVLEPIARVVGAGISVSGEAAGILIELINQHIHELNTSAFDASMDQIKELVRVANEDTMGANFQHLEAAFALIGH